MLFALLIIELKLHLNFDSKLPKKSVIYNVINNDNFEKEGYIYNFDFIRNFCDSNTHLQKLYQKSDINLYGDNLEYNTNSNKVEIKKATIKCDKKQSIDKQPDSLIVIKNVDYLSTSSVIQSSVTLNSDAQIIRFIGEGIHTIKDTDFNLIKKQKFGKKERLLLSECDPTLIIFDDNSKNSIINSKFFNNQNENSQSFYPARCIRTKKECSLNVSNTIFFNGTAYHKGSFFHIESNNEILIFNSQFKSCYDHENCAHAIYASQGRISVKNSIFNNVLSNPLSQGSIILSETNFFNFEGNQFIFNNNSIDCKCILLLNEGFFNINNNEFKNFEANKNGGVLIIEDPSDISFNNNEFTNIKGTGESHSIFLLFNSMINKKLIGNKFKKIHSADRFFCIRSDDEIETNFTFEEFFFEGSKQNGNGIINVQNEDNKTYILIFNNCFFSGNSNIDGGSLLINEDTFPYCKGLVMYYCQMHWNTATGRGSGIAVFIECDIDIFGGDYNRNIAGKGGVFYIENNYQSKCYCKVVDVSFNLNNGEMSHCIWVNTQSFDDNLTLEVNYCMFDNNNDNYYGGGSCILSNCKTTIVAYSRFVADELDHQCGGINVTAKGVLEVKECRFKRCSAGTFQGSYGGCIGYSYHKSDTLDRGRSEKITITDCIFDNNYGLTGVAFMLNVLTTNVFISNNDILNHRMTSYIICIFFKKELLLQDVIL